MCLTNSILLFMQLILYCMTNTTTTYTIWKQPVDWAASRDSHYFQIQSDVMILLQSFLIASSTMFLDSTSTTLVLLSNFLSLQPAVFVSIIANYPTA